MPYCTCNRCDQNADCQTIVFHDDEFFTSNVAYTLCNLCYSMYGELYVNEIVDDPYIEYSMYGELYANEVIYDTDYQEQQAIIQEEDNNPIHIPSLDDESEDPCNP